MFSIYQTENVIHCLSHGQFLTREPTTTHLLDLPDPAVDPRLQLVQEGGVLHLVPKVCDLGLLPTFIALLRDVGDDGVDQEADLRDLNVLLKVEQAHFQLSDLLLNGGSHFVPIPSKLYENIITNVCCQTTCHCSIGE